MKNIYDGVVALDNNGEAEIELVRSIRIFVISYCYRRPWTRIYMLNRKLFLTLPTVKHGSQNDSAGSNHNNGNRFKIAGGESVIKVSWQVTGVRKDPWANAHRIQVEADKERGYYLYPDLYDQPKQRGINYLLFPEDKENEQELLRPYKIATGLEEKRAQRNEGRK